MLLSFHFGYTNDENEQDLLTIVKPFDINRVSLRFWDEHFRVRQKTKVIKKETMNVSYLLV